MKPVAWMSPDGKISQTEGKLFHIPLYAPTKPLSDEEIMEIAKIMCGDHIDNIDDIWVILFARAIEDKHGIK